MPEPTRFLLDSVEADQRSLIRLSPRTLHNFLGPVLRPGEISLIHGSERSLLTLLVHWIAINATTRRHPVAFLDSGSNFSPAAIRSMVSNGARSETILKLIGVGNPYSLEDLEGFVDRAASRSQLRLIVVDSLAGLLNLSGSPGTAERQRQLFKAMESVRRKIAGTRAHVLLTDHSSAWSADSSPLGGLVIAHAVDSIVRIIRLPETRQIVRLIIERSPVPKGFGGIILRINHRGVFSPKRGGV